MAQFSTARTTRQTDVPENRIVRRVDDDLSLLEPSEGPLITLLLQLKKRSSTDTPRLEWYEDDYVARWANISAAGAASGASAMVLAAGSAFTVVPGDMLAVPGAVTSNAVPEIIRVLTVAADGITLTTTRGAAGTATGAIAANAPMRILGSAYMENDLFPSPKVRNPTKVLSYTQIFRTSCQFSKTQVATKTYNAPGGERQREHKKKLKEHKIAMNASFLFGQASEDMTATPGPLRTTMGLNSVVSQNGTAVDAGGQLTYKTFEEFSRRAFRYGKNTKLLLCAPILKSAITFWGFSKLMLTPGETRLGVNIQKVITAHGTWLLTNDWMLENAALGSTVGFGGMGFSIDLDQLDMRYLNANGENRNTHIIENAKRDGVDGYSDEILTEAGLVIKQPLYHTKLYNITDFTNT